MPKRSFTQPFTRVPARPTPTGAPAHKAVAPWAWAGGGALLGTLLALLVFAPARWLADSLARASDQRVQLLAAQGTLWRGSAQLVLTAGADSQTSTILPQRIEWQLRPTLHGLQLAWQTPCCLRSAWLWTVAPTWGGLRVALSDQPASQPSVWPSALLAGLGTPWNTLQLQGALALSTQQLVLQWQAGRWLLAGHAQLDATGMSTSLSTLKPIGSYRLALAGGASPTLELSTLDGSLQLQGSGRWIGGRLQFAGLASAAPERADALANLLNIIGRREGARSIIKVG